MAVATSMSSLSSSIVQCVAVGNPTLATIRVVSDATPMRSLAALPGAIFLVDEIMPAGAGPPMMRSLPSAVAMAQPCSIVAECRPPGKATFDGRGDVNVLVVVIHREVHCCGQSCPRNHLRFVGRRPEA
jgi:hypothetical protein